MFHGVKDDVKAKANLRDLVVIGRRLLDDEQKTDKSMLIIVMYWSNSTCVGYVSLYCNDYILFEQQVPNDTNSLQLQKS